MPRLIVMRMFAGAVALGLLTSCGGGGSGTTPLTVTAASPPAGTTGAAFPGYSFQASGGTPPFSWNESGPMPPGLMLSASGQLSGMPATAGTYPLSVTVTDSSYPPVTATAAVTLTVNGLSFTVLSASMTAPRSGHTATLLASGKVLIAGGANGAADASAELYDPATGAFTATGPMTEARIGHTATLLNDSARSVLIVGSVDMTAELYNPATGTFTATGSMHHDRTSPTATLLSSTGPNAGKVLIVGGNTTSGDLVAELYDPGTGTFTDTSSTTTLRTGHTATLLTTSSLAGQVLIAGGNPGGNASASAELYNPATGMFTTTGDMTVARAGHTATALGTQDGAQNGDVLIVGTDGSADLYDPSKGTFTRIGSLLPSMQRRTAHTANLRSDGTVLAAGGYDLEGSRGLFCPVSGTAAALFAPESDGFTATGSLGTRRDSHTATVLADGTVLIVGGTEHRGCFTGAVVLSSAELFK